MRSVRTAVTVAAVWAACAGALRATEIAPKEFTCPVDETKFTGNALVSTDKLGGMDSDFCAWPKGTPALAYEVQVCPGCFYAARNEYFTQNIAEETRANLKTALDKWRKDHPGVTKVEELEPGRRWELAAVCAIVRQAPAPTVGNLWLRAAYATRQAAGADVRLGFSDPMSSFEILDSLEEGLKKEKDPKKLSDGLIQLAFGCHRAGDVKRRDATVKKLEAMKLDEAQAARLAALRKAFDAEKLYQERTVACFREALSKELVKPEEAHIYLFIVADTTRRLGKEADAVKLYREVKAAGKIRRDVASLCDFLINWLAPE
jgi:hypothetical protein